MQEASFTGFIRTLLYIFLFYYAIKIVFRIFFHMMMNKAVQNMEERFRQQQAAQEPIRKPGETVIDKKPSATQKSKEEGEYIDYEEVE